MTTFSRNIRPHVDAEIALAAQAEARGQVTEAVSHLERAHVIGQSSTVQHVRVHLRMFVWGWRQRSVRECLGQALRIFGASTKTVFGLVPSGNTGGSNISPFKPLPLAPDIEAMIRNARGAE